MNIIDEKRGQVTIEATTEEEGKLLRQVLIPILNAKNVAFHQNRGGDFLTFVPADRQGETFDFGWELKKRKAWLKRGVACHGCKETAFKPGKCPKCSNDMRTINDGDFV